MSDLPKVGDGATVCLHNDRHGATIVSISKNTISVQIDYAERTDERGMSELQDYSYTPNPNAQIMIFTRRKDEVYRLKGQKHTYLSLGHRQSYRDFSF